MTKRSSFVIPAALPVVAVIVDISTLPKSLMQKSALAELGRIRWASPQGNIAVKPAPIRLSALYTAFPGRGGPAFVRSRTDRVERIAAHKHAG